MGQCEKFDCALMKLTIQLEGRERTELKYKFALDKQTHFIPKLVGNGLKLTASDAVRGTPDFVKIRAKVDRVNRQYQQQISALTKTKEKLETSNAKTERI